MRLEADDGRPETSPATTTRRSNGRSRSCTRTASHPGRSGPSTTSRDRPRGADIRTKAGVIRANAARYRRDAGRSPLHLLLDDRASRDGACGSGRRRRARGPALQPRTLRRRRSRPLWKGGAHRVREAHRRHHARTGHAGAYTRRRSEPPGTRAWCWARSPPSISR